MTFEEWAEGQTFYWNELTKEDLEFAFESGKTALKMSLIEATSGDWVEVERDDLLENY